MKHLKYLAANNNLVYTSHVLSKDNNKKNLEIYVHKQTIISSERLKIKSKNRQKIMLS